jgi:hypothetical protein
VKLNPKNIFSRHFIYNKSTLLKSKGVFKMNKNESSERSLSEAPEGISSSEVYQKLKRSLI